MYVVSNHRHGNRYRIHHSSRDRIIYSRDECLNNKSSYNKYVQTEPPPKRKTVKVQTDPVFFEKKYYQPRPVTTPGSGLLRLLTFGLYGSGKARDSMQVTQPQVEIIKNHHHKDRHRKRLVTWVDQESLSSHHRKRHYRKSHHQTEAKKSYVDNDKRIRQEHKPDYKRKGQRISNDWTTVDNSAAMAKDEIQKFREKRLPQKETDSHLAKLLFHKKKSLVLFHLNKSNLKPVVCKKYSKKLSDNSESPHEYAQPKSHSPRAVESKRSRKEVYRIREKELPENVKTIDKANGHRRIYMERRPPEVSDKEIKFSEKFRKRHHRKHEKVPDNDRQQGLSKNQKSAHRISAEDMKHDKKNGKQRHRIEKDYVLVRDRNYKGSNDPHRRKKYVLRVTLVEDDKEQEVSKSLENSEKERIIDEKNDTGSQWTDVEIEKIDSSQSPGKISFDYISEVKEAHIISQNFHKQGNRKKDVVTVVKKTLDYQRHHRSNEDHLNPNNCSSCERNHGQGCRIHNHTSKGRPKEQFSYVFPKVSNKDGPRDKKIDLNRMSLIHKDHNPGRTAREILPFSDVYSVMDVGQGDGDKKEQGLHRDTERHQSRKNKLENKNNKKVVQKKEEETFYAPSPRKRRNRKHEKH